MVQYWRSLEDLGTFAKEPSCGPCIGLDVIQPDAAGTGDVGISHETYRVPADRIETRYGNMAPFGLVKALGARQSFGAPRNSAHKRIGAND